MTGRRGSGPHRSFGNARLRAQRRADRAAQLLHQVLSSEHRCRLIRVELTFYIRANRDDFAVVQFGIDCHVNGDGRLGHGQLGACRHKPLCSHQQMVRAGWDIRNGIGAIRRRRGFELRPLNRDKRAGDGFQ